MSDSNSKELRKLGDTATIVRPDLGGATAGRGEEWVGKASTYYNVPFIKKAHWEWQIILYFFLGGLAGGSYLVTTLAHLFGIDKDDQLMRAGRYISFVCVLASPILLIWDLGRPERFHHMLRVFKLRSPMSLGTWGLTTFGLFCGLSTAHQMAKDGLLNWLPLLARLTRALPMKVIEAVGSIFGMFVACYTGVLLAATAVPLWARARYILGPLFLTSGLSSALASLSCILALSPRNQKVLGRLERAELIALTTELGLISAIPPLLGPLAKPLFRGRIGILFNVGTIAGGVELPLLIRLVWKLTRKPIPRSIQVGSSLLVLIGSLILRYVWVAAGRISADDPGSTHYYNAMERHKKDEELDPLLARTEEAKAEL